MVKIGIIGCGYWGPNLIRNFNQIKDCSVKICADLKDSRLEHIKELYPKMLTTKDYMDIVHDKDIEAVAIATNVSSHYEIAKTLLTNNKHVLVEKPITNNSKYALELIKIAEKNKKVLMVDHTFEYSASVRKINVLIQKNELGKLLTIDMIRVNLGLFQKDINVIWDLAPHDISILLYLLKKMPLSVAAHGMAHIQENIEDDAFMILKFEDKVMAHIHSSWLDPLKIRKITIVGNKKMLVFDDTQDVDKIKIYDKGVSLEKNNFPKDRYYDTWKEFNLVYRSGDTIIPKLENTEPLNSMCRHFIECIKTGNNPLSDGYSGLNVVRVIEALQKSLKNNGKEIYLKGE